MFLDLVRTKIMDQVTGLIPAVKLRQMLCGKWYSQSGWITVPVKTSPYQIWFWNCFLSAGHAWLHASCKKMMLGLNDMLDLTHLNFLLQRSELGHPVHNSECRGQGISEVARVLCTSHIDD